jgi:hypothetical protein
MLEPYLPRPVMSYGSLGDCLWRPGGAFSLGRGWGWVEVVHMRGWYSST